MTATKTIQELCHDFADPLERVSNAELAAHLVNYVWVDLNLEEIDYADASIAKQIVWRGAADYARNFLKQPERLEKLINAGPAQAPLFPDFSEFVMIGETFVRRRALLQAEYREALGLLRKKSTELSKKISRYQNDYDFAAPHWSGPLTFAEAYRLAKEKGT